MSSPTNKTPSKETQEKLGNGFSYDTNLGDNYWAEAPSPVWSQTFEGMNFTVYEQSGEYGWAFYDGKKAIHFGSDGNITMSAGAPGQSGCGGKLVLNTQSQIQKAESVAIEVTGRPDGGTVDKTADSEGNVDEKSLPSYSLKVYGPVNIEALGGDCAIKGDNVVVNANSSLDLRSSKDINIVAGEGGGKINMSASSVNMEAGFFNKELSGGDFTKGAGEVNIEQDKSGAEVIINTPGSIRYVVNGNYNIDVKGRMTTDVDDKYLLNVDKDYGATILGDYANVVQGKALTKINGVGSKSKQQPNYLIDILANQKKSLPGFELNSSSLAQFLNTTDGFKFEVGKQLGSLELTDKGVFSVLTGANLGAINLDKKQAVIEHGKTSKMTITPSGNTFEFGKASKVTVNAQESKIENNGAYVSVKPSDVTIFGPMIYLN